MRESSGSQGYNEMFSQLIKHILHQNERSSRPHGCLSRTSLPRSDNSLFPTNFQLAILPVFEGTMSVDLYLAR